MAFGRELAVMDLDNLLHDARYALRQLRRATAFTTTALLTLAFGIGANFAVFQLVYAVILAGLPVPHPEELVRIHAARSPFDQSWTISYPAYQRLREATPDVPLMATAYAQDATLELPNHASVQAGLAPVSDNYFSGLGVAPAAGRLFMQADEHLGQSEWPAVLRYDFARNTFGSAPQAVGQHILLNARPFVVIGVAHRRFLGDVTGRAPDIWMPLALQSAGAFAFSWDSLGPGHDVSLGKPWYNQPTIFWLVLTARIQQERRAAVLAHWDQVFRNDREVMTEATADPAVKDALLRVKTTVAPMADNGMRKRFTVPLTLLMALSISIFLVGCLNLANLQLARLHARGQDMGVRIALGARSGRLVRQIVLEDALLVAGGAVCAFALGRAASGVLVRWASSRNSLLTLDLHPNLPVAVLGVGLMLLSLLCFSILPAILFIRNGVVQAAGSRAKVAGIAQTARQRLRSNVLLGTQVSLSVLLSAMSGCFAATLVHWETVDVGMDREHVLVVRPELHEPRYTEHPELLPGLYGRIQERLNAVPGVRSAAVEMCGGIHCGWITALYVHGRSNLTDAQVHGQEDHVGLGFFSTLGIPMLHGRDFSASDTEKTQHVAIISRAYARQLFGDADPIGQWVGYEPAPNDHKFLIVGEVADARMNGAQREAPPMVYMDINQNPAPVSIRVRAMGDPRRLSDSVRRALYEVDPTLQVSEIVPLATELNGDLGTEKLLARLAVIYGSLTLLLVAIGFYGVMSARTARRRSEFGIRLALGATRGHIQALIVGQTARILAAGIVPGAVLSILAERYVGHLLYGSVSANSLAIVGAGVVLALAGLVATLIPARRAAFADPLETLRSE
ncbi:ADOP family duplicated permease [Occallatibacter riparius]|uniref:ADOP family duplicated permease n=1 Tax=Occallatibacter riparius TaxID=1002689 RepID=A0A9J7BQG0_9BACT|nr:ADOP family duplicated permease [Occallatibacter riparius]UWZ83333.1 ADOP family duplicated permease [Occallatibacter riparius]